MDARNGVANGKAHRERWYDRLGRWLQPRTDPLLEARRQVEFARSQAELTQLQRTKKLLEDSPISGDLWLTPYLQLLDRSSDFGQPGYFVTNYADRQYGRAFPFYINETQLAIIRAQARVVCTKNSYAVGLLTGLTSFVIGAGFTYRAAAKAGKENTNPKLVAAVQEEIDLFCKRNQWKFFEQELFWRSRQDGEFFLRYFQSDDDVLIVRTIEPEQIRQPPGSDYREYSFGILSDPEDVVQVYGYWAHYLDTAGYHNGQEGEEIPVEQVLHFKCNAPRTVKRGLTDFSFDVYDALHAASKIRFNAGESSAVQAAIAIIRQWEVATQQQVSTFAQSGVDMTTTNPVTGRQVNYTEQEPGSILDIPRGLTYIPPPGSAPGAMEAHETILHVQLRAAGTRWNAPEWLATSSGADMAAYTASLTAENPFVKTSVRYQDQYEEAFTQVITRAVQVAIDAGRLPPDTLKRVDIQCEGPSIEAKNELQEAQANTLRIQGGWKSRQTVAQEEGLDFELEMQNQEEFQERFGGLVGAPGAEQPPENDENDSESEDKGNDQNGKTEGMPALPSSLIEQIGQKHADRSQQVIRAAAKLLAARKPDPPPAPVLAAPGVSPDVASLCEAVKALSAREAGQLQPIIQLPKEISIPPIPAPVVNVAAPEIPPIPAPVVNIAAPEIPRPEVIQTEDSVEKIIRDSKGRMSEVHYASGRVLLIKRDKEGKITKTVPKKKET